MSFERTYEGRYVRSVRRMGDDILLLPA